MSAWDTNLYKNERCIVNVELKRKLPCWPAYRGRAIIIILRAHKQTPNYFSCFVTCSTYSHIDDFRVAPSK